MSVAVETPGLRRLSTSPRSPPISRPVRSGDALDELDDHLAVGLEYLLAQSFAARSHDRERAGLRMRVQSNIAFHRWPPWWVVRSARKPVPPAEDTTISSSPRASDALLRRSSCWQSGARSQIGRAHV